MASPHDIDDLSAEEIAARKAQTDVHVQAIRDLWPNLQRLEEIDRTSSGGKNLSSFVPALLQLFAILRGKDPKEVELASQFNALGDEDFGDDPEKFEPELLERRILRVAAEQKIQASLDDLQRHFADDVLHTGNQVMAPGLLALALARTLSATNKKYKSLLAPVIDKLREMTKAARAGAANAVAKKKAAAGK
ncbi:MAG: hypothetical protein ABJE95_28805 [Byssovorax sp.]